MKNTLKTILSFILFVYQISFAQQHNVDIVDFIKEIQIIKKVDSNMKMVWWIPTEYWNISTKGSPLATKEALEEIENAIGDYTIFAALDGDIGVGRINYKDTVKIKIVVPNNEEFLPMENDEISKETKNILRTLKPVFVNMIGDMGRNLNFYVFQNMDSAGNRILTPQNNGSFTVKLNDEDFQWILPLDSFVPKKKCPIDKKEMSGSWNYCPWHGEILIE